MGTRGADSAHSLAPAIAFPYMVACYRGTPITSATGLHLGAPGGGNAGGSPPGPPPAA